MMAWHPRLGQQSPIKNYVPKDVGKLIARTYITMESQITDERCRSRGRLDIRAPLGVVFQKREAKIVTGKRAALYTVSVIDQALCKQYSSAVQTPVMSIVFPLTSPWGIGQQDTSKGKVVFTHQSESGKQFIEWMKMYCYLSDKNRVLANTNLLPDTKQALSIKWQRK